MREIFDNIKDFVFLITHPEYWMMENLKYDKNYDKQFNSLLDTYGFSDHDDYTIKLGDTRVWTRNIPYSCFFTVDYNRDYYGILRPSRRTIHKAFKKLKKYFKDKNIEI